MKQLHSTMKHIFCDGFGSPQVMKLKESPLPTLKPNQVLLRIFATSMNRAETNQRQGKYPSVPGQTDILGLEGAGQIVNEDGSLGQRVIALLPGGGYAQYAAVNKDHVIPISENIPWEIAGSLAEVYLTAFLQISLARLQKGDTCLVYAAASGVGIATIQLCHLKGIVPIASCSKGKIETVQRFTPHVIDRNLPVEEQIKFIKSVDPNGVDGIFDPVGASFAKLSLEALKMDGRWVLYGLMGGHQVDQFALGTILRKRIQLIGTTLKNRSDEFKAQLITDFSKAHISDVENGTLKPVIHEVNHIKWNDDVVEVFQRYHEEMEKNENIGKLVVVFDE